MSVAKTDVALGIVMVLSLILLHILGEHGFLGGLFALPPTGGAAILRYPIVSSLRARHCFRT